MMEAKLKNLLTGEIIQVHSTKSSIASSYGQECWVDDSGIVYGICDFGTPLGYVFLNESDDKVTKC